MLPHTAHAAEKALVHFYELFKYGGFVMSEKKKYTEEEIEILAEQAAQNAMNHYKYGVS